MDLNVKALFFLTRDLLPLLQKNATATDPARVINLGSIDGIRVPTLETYPYSGTAVLLCSWNHRSHRSFTAASKAAVHQLTRVLANRLAPMHITVNAIAAGPFEVFSLTHAHCSSALMMILIYSSEQDDGRDSAHFRRDHQEQCSPWTHR